jgi:hypothetical protein
LRCKACDKSISRPILIEVEGTTHEEWLCAICEYAATNDSVELLTDEEIKLLIEQGDDDD